MRIPGKHRYSTGAVPEFTVCWCRATLAEISRDNEYSILYGLVACACNIALALMLQVVGVLSKSSGGGDGDAVAEHSGTGRFLAAFLPVHCTFGASNS